MKKKSRQFFIIFMSGVALCLSLVVLLNVSVDTLQIYHSASFYPPRYTTEQRLQNIGLANTLSYEAMIIGTSMTENFMPSEVAQTFNVQRAAKFSFSGAYAYELQLMMDKAFQTQDVKHVLIGLDYTSMRLGPYKFEDAHAFPTYLYDDTIWNDAPYLLNIATLNDSIDVLKRYVLNTNLQTKQSIDLLNNWDETASYGAKYVKNHYLQALQREALAKDEPDVQLAYDAFDIHILETIKQHPNTQFHLYFPPYHITRYQVWERLNPERLRHHFAWKTYVFKQLQNLKNVQLYDFQANLNWITNSHNYKDMSHHSGALNSDILKSMNRHEFLITHEQTLQKNENTLRSQISTYKLQ